MDQARIQDDHLIAFATTCSDQGIALAAEMALRKRYPSKISIRRKDLARENAKTAVPLSNEEILRRHTSWRFR